MLCQSVGFKGRQFVAGLLLTVGLIACFKPKPETVDEIRRGRLRCTEMVERKRVNNYWWEVFIDEKPFVPEGRDSNKVGQCQASRNPDVERVGGSIGR